MENEYILVRHPESQRYIQFPWFQYEACLLNPPTKAMSDEREYAGAYFIPKHRIIEVEGLKVDY